jgi:hypothetical protein
MAGKRTGASRLEIELVDLEEGRERPALTIYAVDRAGAVLHRADVDAKGGVAVPPAVLEKASELLVGPPLESLEGVERSSLARFHAGDVLERLKEGAALELGPTDWGKLVLGRRCVGGSVQKCWFPPFFVRDLLLEASPQRSIAFDRRKATSLGLGSGRALARAEDLALASPTDRLSFLRRCEKVCDGLVIVYRRTCCCPPIVIDDPRLDDVLDRLREIVEIIPWPPDPDPGPIGPPGPGPDPAPFGLFAGGTLGRAAVNAPRDLYALQTLDARAKPQYILERPYLRPFWCHCGPAKQVGQGSLRPDGTFHICWSQPLSIFQPHCHDEYAFVVRQNINGATVTVYDGLAASEWFHSSSGIVLTTYDRRALSCRENEFPGGAGAFVLLQDIGATASHRLKTPDADGPESVQTPVDYNHGLVNPAASPAAAKGHYLDQNWGGTLALRYHFSEPMKTAPAVGAKYYRISVSAADANGDPTGSRSYFDQPLSWLYYQPSGTDVLVLSEPLGPFSAGGEGNLYVIPYDADHDWQSGQFHGSVDTTDFANARHLITIEVFDSAGNRLRPAGSTGAGTNKAFTFRRWYQPIGPTANVPFAALTHMFWWDNRKAIAQIVDLRKGSVASSDECQFLVAPGAEFFRAGYRAYHPDDMFILNHIAWWRRGLGGPSGTLINSPDNAGKPPDPVAVTPTTSPPAQPDPPTFANMLDEHTKCSFSLNLHVNVKTTNGSGILDSLDADDQAAFALEKT